MFLCYSLLIIQFNKIMQKINFNLKKYSLFLMNKQLGEKMLELTKRFN